MKWQLISVILLLVLLPTVFAQETGGELSVSSEPDGAKVYVGGAYKGETPVTLSGLRVGKTFVKLSKSGYKDDGRTVIITDEEVTDHHIILQPLQQKSEQYVTLRVDADQPGATVYLDGEVKGFTPRTITRLTAGKEYALKVTKPNYQDYAVTVVLREDQKILASLLSRTSASQVLVEEKPSQGKKILEVKPQRAIAKRPVEKSTLMGRFSISSSPADAEVYIDGESQGKTPLTVSVASIHKHEVLVVKEGHHDYNVMKSVDPDELEVISAVLTKKIGKGDETGSMYVASTPSGAEVYVDEVFRGNAPVLVSRLSLGNHAVRVSKVGYKDYKGIRAVSARMVANMKPALASLRRLDTRTGDLYITSAPPSASVWVDGEHRGETPLRVQNVYTGQHEVKVTKPGYREYSVSKHVPPQRIVNILAMLVPEQDVTGETGTVYVRSVPLRSDVYIDGELKGKTPFTLSGLPVGSYGVKVEKEGYVAYTTTADIKPRKTTDVWAKLERE